MQKLKSFHNKNNNTTNYGIKMSLSDVSKYFTKRPEDSKIKLSYDIFNDENSEYCSDHINESSIQLSLTKMNDLFATLSNILN